METQLKRSPVPKLKKRAKAFLVILGLFILMSVFKEVHEVYLLFYLKVIKAMWAVLHYLTLGKLHLIILVITLINFLKLFIKNSLKEFFIKLSSGVLYVVNAFFILWGFNYAQPTLPVAETLTETQLIELKELAENQVNQLRAQVTDNSYLRGVKLDKESKTQLFLELKTQTDSLIPDARYYAPPVPFFGDGKLRMMGIGGIYFPFSGEALYDDSSPLLRKTFTYTHEFFHAQSVTGEDECNYLAWKTLTNSGNAHWQYSAMFDLYFTTARLLGLTSEELQSAVSEEVWQDVEFLKQERKAYTTWFHSVSATTNNAYLKMLSSSEGTAAYEGYVKWAYLDLLSASN